MMDTRETTINLLEEDGEIHLYSNIRRHVNAMKKMMENNPEIHIVRECADGGVFFQMPASFFRLPRPKRQMSEDAVAAARGRMLEMRKKSADNGEDVEFDT